MRFFKGGCRWRKVKKITYEKVTTLVLGVEPPYPKSRLLNFMAVFSYKTTPQDYPSFVGKNRLKPAPCWASGKCMDCRQNGSSSARIGEVIVTFLERSLLVTSKIWLKLESRWVLFVRGDITSCFHISKMANLFLYQRVPKSIVTVKNVTPLERSIPVSKPHL